MLNWSELPSGTELSKTACNLKTAQNKTSQLTTAKGSRFFRKSHLKTTSPFSKTAPDHIFGS